MDSATDMTDNTHARLDAESCYRALSAKDTRFDGVFFVGVKTTGIYCRTVCTVKTPRRASCVFFQSAAAAEAAGFRPCLRCRPELAPYALQQNLAYAIWQRIAAGVLNDGDIEALSHEVGLSSRQLRRVLQQHFGVTPVELAQTQRLLFAKKLLQETRLPMADVAYAAGFGSVRRFNALFAARYGMAPGAIRRAAIPDSATAEDVLTLRLAYRPPFDWPRLLRYLSVRGIPGVEAVQGGEAPDAYARSVRIGEARGWVRVVDKPARHQLELQVASSMAGVLMPLLARVRGQFDLDANPAVIEAHLRQDPLLAARLDGGGVRVPGGFDAFELAVRAVLGQQISVAGATTLSGRLAARFGDALATPHAAVTRLFPLPQMLARIDVNDMASIGLPKARAQTLAELARFAAEGGLSIRPGMPLDETVRHLKSVRGIGDWTAHYIALRALRFSDAFPEGDLGLRKAAAEDHPAGMLSAAQLAARAAGWAPWRGYAALILWMQS